MTQQTITERALQLAREGPCRSVEDIRRKLKEERFDLVDSHLSGATLMRQLVDAMKLLD